MKKTTWIALVIAWILPLHSCSQTGTESLNIMTFNIRYDTPQDGPDAWPNRKQLAAGTIRFHQADIVGLQEALLHQLEDLSGMLPLYGWFGVGRDDGRSAGEFSPVLYRTDRLVCREQGTFWLSETPDTVSRGWDAACNRIVTWGLLKDKSDGKDFFVFNTHFDHMGQIARKESALLLRKKVREISDGKPFVLTGDFNAVPDSEPIQLLLESPAILDSRAVCPFASHGPTYTFTGFDPVPKAEGEPIDYVFISPGFRVIRHATLSDQVNGRLPSDHYPVFAEIR